MINQESKAQGRTYQVLPNFGICWRELVELKVTSFHACVGIFLSVGLIMRRTSSFDGLAQQASQLASMVYSTNASCYYMEVSHLGK